MKRTSRFIISVKSQRWRAGRVCQYLNIMMRHEKRFTQTEPHLIDEGSRMTQTEKKESKDEEEIKVVRCFKDKRKSFLERGVFEALNVSWSLRFLLEILWWCRNLIKVITWHSASVLYVVRLPTVDVIACSQRRKSDGSQCKQFILSAYLLGKRQE